jgi:hypothetical protein
LLMHNEMLHDSHSPSVINYNEEDKEDERERAYSMHEGEEQYM